jgi:hypothetical protein
VKLDYTRCEEGFLPYYPVMNDARRVSQTLEAIVCIPTNTFRASRRALLRRDLSKVQKTFRNRITRVANGARNASATSSRGQTGDDWTNRGESGPVGFVRRAVKRYTRGQTYVSDLSHMNYAMMVRMMDSIRERAARSGLKQVAVILENHTKDVQDFSDIERFLTQVAHSTDVKTVTLTEIAKGLQDGSFKVRTA